MKKLKYAFIGCGGIATSKHYSAMESLKDIVEVVAVCDIIEEKAIASGKHFNLPEDRVFTDYKELLKIEEIDAVLVLTPNISHSFISVDAMRAGKHVMCEKPMAINAEEAKKMVDAQKETGKLLTIGYQNRYRQDSLTMKKASESGDLGEIYYAKSHAVRRRAVPTWGVFTDKEKQGGGPLIDIGTHALDLTLWAMDNYEPHMVLGSTFNKLCDSTEGNAFGAWEVETFDVEDSAFGMIKMKNGATIYLEATWALNTRDVKEAKCTLHGTKAGLDMEDGLVINTAKYGKLVEEHVDFSTGAVPFFEGASLSEEVIEGFIFASAIKGEGSLTVEPQQAYIVTEILEAIYKSAATGEAVYFE